MTDEFLDDVLDESPRAGLIADLTDRILAESRAVPDGRFALLRRTGFTVAMRIAPLPS